MKKKNEYIKPEMEIVEVEGSMMLAISKLGYSDNDADKDLEVLSNDRRGSWGNLWN